MVARSIPRGVSSLLLAGVALGALAFGVPDGRVAGVTGDTDVRVTGLPEGVVPEIYLVEPADGGGYHRRTPVGAATQAQVRVPAGFFVEAAPIFLDETQSLQPVRRFQPAAPLIEFTYERRFLVTVSHWSRGGLPGDTVGGTVTRESQWVPSGQSFSATAVPHPGWRVAHWGVFGASEQASSRRSSTTASTISVLVDRPMHLVVGFVPID